MNALARSIRIAAQIATYLFLAALTILFGYALVWLAYICTI